MEISFDPDAEALQFRTRLEELAARPAWGPHKIHLRIATPNLRAIVKERSSVVEAASVEEIGTLVDRLWNGVTYDEMFLAVEILRRRPEAVTRDRMEAWQDGLDQWGVTDALASVLRAWVADDPDQRFGYLEDLASRDAVWPRRLALASTVLLSREGRAVDRTLALVASVLDDRRRMIVNAVSWALREIVKSEPGRVEAFVDEHADELPARVRLEVRNKLRTGRKDGRRGAALRERFTRAGERRRKGRDD
ncbi:MAG: DNA alkylation repair protein [Acidimicrobiia bacterium]|nr:DNA alkylation repair protein [Acidimicrobiia bacterium]